MGKFCGLSLVIVLAVAVPSAGGKQPRVDRYGDPLPEGAVARLGSKRWRHPGGVSALAFSPDGRFLLSAGHDGEQGADVLRLWEVPTGRLVRRYTGLKGPIDSVRFSPDGRLLAAASDSGACCVWDAATGKARQHFHPRQTSPDFVVFPPSRMTFSPDCRLLAWSGMGRLVLWDLSVGKPLYSLHKSQKRTCAVGFSPDGRLFAAADDQTIVLLEAKTGKQVARLKATVGKERVQTLAFSPMGRILAGADSGGTVRLWNIATRKQAGQMRGSNDVRALAFSPDGRTLAAAVASSKWPALFWEVATGKLRWRLPGPLGRGRCIAFAPDGKFLAVAGLYDPVILLIDSATGKERVSTGGYEGDIGAIAFSPDGRQLAAGGIFTALRLWDPRTGEELRRLTGPRSDTTGLAYSPDGRTLAVSGFSAPVCRRWLVGTGKELPTWRPRSGESASSGVSFAPDGKLLAHVGPSGLTVWKVAGGKECFSLPAPGSLSLQAVAFSPYGRTLAVGTSGDAHAKEETVRFCLWEIPSRFERGHYGGRLVAAESLVFSADGRSLASMSGDSVRLWEVLTGRERGRIHANQAGNPRRMALSPDGRLLALAGQDGTIRLWSATKFKELRTLRGHDGAVTALAFSPDGRLLASGSMDATVLVWDVAAGRHD